MNLFLIGYRCTGKTRVGKQLARILNQTFVDTDAAIVRAEGVSVAEMVAAHGWPYFRQQEKESLAALCQKRHQVIATGGGIILDPENVARMKAGGKIVWLKAEPETIKARILADAATSDQRPALTENGLVPEIQAVLAERTPLYRKAADFAVDTDGIAIEGICDRILGWLYAEF